jgi:uncharacterized protein
MRTASNERLTEPGKLTASLRLHAKEAPERRCILTQRLGSPEQLIRLALGPDGQVAADLRARLGGRGAWLAVDQATLQAALAKGKLKGALARAFKTAAFNLDEDLPATIAAGLRQVALDRLGLEMRAGHILLGADRIGDAAKAGRLYLLLHAADAARDGIRKLTAALKPDATAGHLDFPADRAILSQALGRENAVHAGITDPAAAKRIALAVNRWRNFTNLSNEEPPVLVEQAGLSAEALKV